VGRVVFFGTNREEDALPIFRIGSGSDEIGLNGRQFIGAKFAFKKRTETAIGGLSRWLHQIAVQGAIYPFWHNPVDVLHG
jgi:hypothetical protein